MPHALHFTMEHRTLRSLLSMHAAASGGGDARISMEDRDKKTWPSDCFYLSTDVLALKNPFPQDQRIRFVESTHKYYIDGKLAPISVTSFVHAPFDEFDAMEQAFKQVEKARSGNPRAKYPNMTAREIARAWLDNGAQQSSLGTTMHAAIEVYLNTGYWSRDVRVQYELSLARDFVQKEIVDRGLEVYRTEPTIYVDPQMHPKQYVLPGSVDCICRDPKTDELHIFDWKRSKQIDKTKNGFGGYGTVGPLTQHENVNFVQYSLQLHVYRHILVNYYGKKVPKDALFIVVFHPSNSTYLKIPTADMSAEVDWLMENYELCLQLGKEHDELKQRNLRWALEPDTIS
jgi:ATP-dependent exoDNAse (exonuclease V) beta subunit